VSHLLCERQERKDAYAKKLRPFPADGPTTTTKCCQRKCLFGGIPTTVLRRIREQFLDRPTQVSFEMSASLHYLYNAYAVWYNKMGRSIESEESWTCWTPPPGRRFLLQWVPTQSAGLVCATQPVSPPLCCRVFLVLPRPGVSMFVCCVTVTVAWENSYQFFFCLFVFVI
jgi:hypothetical protein